MKHLLRAKCCAKHFTNVISLNPVSKPSRQKDTAVPESQVRKRCPGTLSDSSQIIGRRGRGSTVRLLLQTPT